MFPLINEFISFLRTAGPLLAACGGLAARRLVVSMKTRTAIIFYGGSSDLSLLEPLGHVVASDGSASGW